MTAINHGLFGALIAVAIPNPYIAVPLALLSHFVLDALPHFGRSSARTFNKVFAVDSVLVISFFSILALSRPNHWPLLMICAFAAMSPDLMWAPKAYRVVRRLKQKHRNFIQSFHKGIQWGERPWGLAIEVGWFICFSLILVSAVNH